jgi:hypothetical protein
MREKREAKRGKRGERTEKRVERSQGHFKAHSTPMVLCLTEDIAKAQVPGPTSVAIPVMSMLIAWAP